MPFGVLCPKCAKVVYQNAEVALMGKKWHPQCFGCKECGKPLQPGTHKEHEGNPYCDKHYGEACRARNPSSKPSRVSARFAPPWRAAPVSPRAAPPVPSDGSASETPRLSPRCSSYLRPDGLPGFNLDEVEVSPRAAPPVPSDGSASETPRLSPRCSSYLRPDGLPGFNLDDLDMEVCASRRASRSAPRSPREAPRSPRAVPRSPRAAAGARERPASLEPEISAWVEAVTGEAKGNKSFGEWLRDGQVLCRLAAKIEPGSCPTVNAEATPVEQIDHVASFIQACRNLGVLEKDLFSTVDLSEQKDLIRVQRCLGNLGSAVRTSAPSFQGPWLGPSLRPDVAKKLRESGPKRVTQM